MTAYLDTIDDDTKRARGALDFAFDDTGALLRLTFLDGRYERTIEQELEREGFHVARDPERTVRARTELPEYCAATRQTFYLPLVRGDTDWQNAVWRALASIHFGETRTYGEVIAMVGRPKAARAAGGPAARTASRSWCPVTTCSARTAH